MTYDVFISHASEDKDKFVRQLATKLIGLGCKVWYDEFALKLGDSLSRSIDYGLSQSNFGIVVISNNFISKSWTDYELRGLTSKEIIGKKKTILPILFGIDIAKVADFSPTLADKISLNANDLPFDDLCHKVLEVIRPDLLADFAKTILAKRLNALTGENLSDISDRLCPSQPMARTLSSQQIVRVRMLRAYLYPYIGDLSVGEWFDSFSYQESPELHILWWENLCVCYMEFARYSRRESETDFLHFAFQYIYCRVERIKFLGEQELHNWLTDDHIKVIDGLISGEAVIE